MKFEHAVIWNKSRETVRFCAFARGPVYWFEPAIVRTKHANRLYSSETQIARLTRYFTRALASGQGRARGTAKRVDKPSLEATVVHNLQRLETIRASYPVAPSKSVANQYPEMVFRDLRLECETNDNARTLWARPASYKPGKKSSQSHIGRKTKTIGRAVKHGEETFKTVVSVGYTDETVADLVQDAIAIYYERRADKTRLVNALSDCAYEALSRFHKSNKRRGKLTDKESKACWTVLRGQASRQAGLDLTDIAYYVNDDDTLWDTERAAIRLLVDGYSRTEVASQLGLSKMQVTRLCQAIASRLPLDYFERVETVSLPTPHIGTSGRYHDTLAPTSPYHEPLDIDDKTTIGQMALGQHKGKYRLCIDGACI